MNINNLKKKHKANTQRRLYISLNIINREVLALSSWFFKKLSGSNLGKYI